MMIRLEAINRRVLIIFTHSTLSCLFIKFHSLSLSIHIQIIDYIEYNFIEIVLNEKRIQYLWFVLLSIWWVNWVRWLHCKPNQFISRESSLLEKWIKSIIDFRANYFPSFNDYNSPFLFLYPHLIVDLYVCPTSPSTVPGVTLTS